MCTLQNTEISPKSCGDEIKAVLLLYQIKNMYNTKTIESMKKTAITLATIISAVIMCSCGSNGNKEELIHMRDSIQQVTDEYTEWSRELLNQCDSIMKQPRTKTDTERWDVDNRLEQAKRLSKLIEENNEKLFQLDLEINK